ncbi:MAG: substrate-binding domain-containing protein [Chloroflexi bacterium]|nr:substrate-binding domain-containing protein [Chloroflexota bacterium]MCL5275952.1 substrate-binding domain-containing protein [Chloroflexota bacterium]
MAGRLALCAVFLLQLAGCSRVETPKITPVTAKYRIATDGETLALMRALTDAYTAAHPTVTFTVEEDNAKTAADAVYARSVDLAAVSLLPPKTADRAAPWVADLAMEGVGVIVNPANPLDNLSTQELRDVFAGVRSRWSDVGVVGLGDIDVGVREDGDGTRVTFDQHVMESAKLGLSDIVLPSIEVAMNFVAYQPAAIAYVPSARITSTVSPIVKVIGIAGQKPTAAAIAAGSYPLTQMLNLIALSEPQGELRNFVAWALGPEGQAIVIQMNYVGVTQGQR